MSRQYPNISMHLKELMKLHNIDDARLSSTTEINIRAIKKILKGEKRVLSIRNLYIMSKEFGMHYSEFIDFISQ